LFKRVVWQEGNLKYTHASSGVRKKAQSLGAHRYFGNKQLVIETVTKCQYYLLVQDAMRPIASAYQGRAKLPLCPDSTGNKRSDVAGHAYANSTLIYKG